MSAQQALNVIYLKETRSEHQGFVSFGVRLSMNIGKPLQSIHSSYFYQTPFNNDLGAMWVF